MAEQGAMPYQVDALAGATILVAEDEYFLADYVAAAIQSAGGAVLGPFPSVAEALARLADEPRPDAATLNVRLLDGESYRIADELARLDVPFVFASATQGPDLPGRFAQRPLLTKPFAAYQIVLALTALLEGRHRTEDHRSDQTVREI